MSSSAAIIEISVILSDELLQRLERIPGQEGTGKGCSECDRPPTLRYRFRRDFIQRISDLVFDFPAPAEDLLWKSIKIPVDINADRPWLPLVTHRMLPRLPEELQAKQGADQLIAEVASALANMGEKATEAKRIAKERYEPGDTFDTLLKKSLGRGRG